MFLVSLKMATHIGVTSITTLKLLSIITCFSILAYTDSMLLGLVSCMLGLSQSMDRLPLVLL